VIHLAAYYSFSGERNHLYKDLTIDGTDRLLRELQNFEVGQFIFSSSMLVYKPNQRGAKLTEESELGPTWAYPKSKVDTEELIRVKHGKIPVVILRIAGVYTNICQCLPISHQIQRIYERRLEGHLYPGDVRAEQSLVHLEDVVLAFDACIKKADQLSNFEIFNIGEDDAMTYDALQRNIAETLLDEAWPTIEVPKPLAQAGAWLQQIVALPLREKPFIRPWMIDRADDNYDLDIEKARRLLGWQPEHSLRNTLPGMLEGIKVDPSKWYKLNKLPYHGPQPVAEEPAPMQLAAPATAPGKATQSVSFEPDQALPEAKQPESTSTVHISVQQSKIEHNR
jgi:nucleoside-diphosphate-sugar epimerase